MKLIDLIIPVYKAQDTIDIALASVAIQSIRDKVKVTLVIDCDGLNYEKTFKRYKDLIDIDIITLKKNGGPGVARQIGINNSNLPYIAFLDADDTFASPFSMEMMLNKLLESPRYVVSSGAFLDKLPNIFDFRQHTNDDVWVFAKLYKRSFLQKYNIQFSNIRTNEDMGFNRIVKLCTNEKEQINYYYDNIYIWQFNPNSITRKDDFIFAFGECFVDYVANVIYAINHARQVNPFNAYIDIFCIQTMAYLYLYFVRTTYRDVRFIDQNFEQSRIFYEKIYMDVEKRIPIHEVIPVVSDTLQSRAHEMKDIVPDITFFDFVSELKNITVSNQLDDKEENE